MTPSEALDPSPHAGATPPAPRPGLPRVRACSVEDIVSAVESGLRDMRAAPLHSLFFGAIYALGGNMILLLAAKLGYYWIAFPMAAGFALIGPFVAVGLYEVSRRRQTGEPMSFPVILAVVFKQSKRELGWMALISLFAFIIWMYQVRLLYAFTFGLHPLDTTDLAEVLFGTFDGVLFLSLGTVWGAILAVAVFALTVVSFPLLLDRDVDFVTAMITSVKAVVASPAVMIGWALVTAALLIMAMLPFFVGLLVVLPILGHATWHLYTRLVDRTV